MGVHQDFKEAYEDLGLDYQQVLKEMSESHLAIMKIKKFKYYEASADGTKLKPWQNTENEFYLSWLLHTGQPAKFIEFMNEHLNKLKYDSESLINIATGYGYTDVIEYLKTEGKK